MMENKSDRRSTLVSTVAWVTPSGDSKIFSNRLSGNIAFEERCNPEYSLWVSPRDGKSSSQGGGYNAIFIPSGDSRTLAEISPEELLEKGYRELSFRDFLLWYREQSEVSGVNRNE